jgi:hypothetical protein
VHVVRVCVGVGERLELLVGSKMGFKLLSANGALLPT